MTSNSTGTIDTYPPPQLKGFHIEKRLGTGTYASVYKAISKKTNEVSAIKCIKKNGLNKASTENLLQEIKILKQIKHDYIVQLKDFQWDENYIYLIMEYCSGGDLSTFIKSRRTIPEKYVRRFVQQIACALKHLHSKGIAHMDLKPQNILLTSSNNPSLKLADFGFALFMREDKKSRSLRGSPLYMAPEILKCKVYDSKVDLWSVGVILYEVIFGYAPFVSSSLDELEKKILDDTPIQIPTHIMLSETCKDLLKRLLERNPMTRITFDEFFSHPFVDLDHMASSSSYPQAIELLNKAVRADERKQYLIAQRYYLQSIEYLIPSIQFEKDPQKKQEIREKAKIYLHRAEELASMVKPSSAASRPKVVYNIPITIQSNAPKTSGEDVKENTPIDKTFSDMGIGNISPLAQSHNSTNLNVAHNTSDLTTISSMDNIQNNVSKYQKLLKQFNGNSQVQEAILMCFDADEKQPDENNCEVLYNQYEMAISKLLPILRSHNMSKENETVLKLNVNKWLTRAEHLKSRLKGMAQRKQEIEIMIARESTDSQEIDEMDKETSLKQCTIQ